MRTRQGFRRLVPVVLALGLLGVVDPAAQAQAACVVSAADQVIESEEHKFLGLINQHRATNGRPALAGHPDLTRAAAWMSRDMATRNFLPPDHVDSNGRDIPTRFTACAVTYGWWGENIYAGTTGLAQDAFDWWKNSAPHNTNMLNANFTSIGIARAYDANSTYKYWWTTTFSDSRRDPIANFDNDLDSERLGLPPVDLAVVRPGLGPGVLRGER